MTNSNIKPVWITSNGKKIYRITKKRFGAFLIQANNLNVLVDTSRKSERKLLIQNLDKLGVKNLDYLILTHTHYDHVENAAFLTSKYNVKVIANQNDIPFTQSGDTPLPHGTNFFVKALIKLGGSWYQKKVHYEPFSIDFPIKNTELINVPKALDNCIKILLTPGHTKSSISITIDDEIAIVGDTMFGIIKGSIFPPFADDVPKLIQSWDKLLKTGCKQFFPAHGNFHKRNLVEKQLAKFEKKKK